MIPQYLPQVVSFQAFQGENEIVLQISNFYRPSGGLLNSIQLGGEAQLLETRYNGIAYELFLFGALMMMGIYHLALFFFRKKGTCAAVLWTLLYSGGYQNLIDRGSLLFHAFPGL